MTSGFLSSFGINPSQIVVSPQSSIVIPNYGYGYGLLNSFQTSMSVLKILTAITRTMPHVQIPRDRSNVLASRDSLGMDTAAEVKSHTTNIVI